MADVITAATDTLTVGANYSPVTWTSGETELNAAHMNHIEDQLTYLTNQSNDLITRLNQVQNNSNTGIASKAPIYHADSSTKYGVATTGAYGHTKLYNGLGRSSYVNGEALSSYQGYLLNQKIVSLQNGNLTSAVPTMQAVELVGQYPYVDFHFGHSTSDYTSRLIAWSAGTLTCTGNFNVEGFTNGFKMKAGSIVKSCGGGTSVYMFNNSDIKSMLGVNISVNNVSILVTNGHAEAQAAHIEGATYVANEGNWYAVFDRHVWGLIRINYVIFYWG